MPTPGKNESQDAFMARCMGMMKEENQTKHKASPRPHDQQVAICMSLWKNKGKKTASQSAIDEQASKFMVVFLEKYPEYKSFFEEAHNDG